MEIKLKGTYEVYEPVKYNLTTIDIDLEEILTRYDYENEEELSDVISNIIDEETLEYYYDYVSGYADGSFVLDEICDFEKIVKQFSYLIKPEKEIEKSCCDRKRLEYPIENYCGHCGKPLKEINNGN